MNLNTNALTEHDRPIIKHLIEQYWSGPQMVIKGQIYSPHECEGYITRRGEQVVGWITFQCNGDSMMLTSLNSVERGMGIGSNLILRIIEEARRRHIRRIWLTTTNDNLHSLWFYQRLGFRLVSVYSGSVDQARKTLKPQIAEHGPNGLPIHDEIELELLLGPYSN